MSISLLSCNTTNTIKIYSTIKQIRVAIRIVLNKITTTVETNIDSAMVYVKYVKDNSLIASLCNFVIGKKQMHNVT